MHGHRIPAMYGVLQRLFGRQRASVSALSFNGTSRTGLYINGLNVNLPGANGVGLFALRVHFDNQQRGLGWRKRNRLWRVGGLAAPIWHHHQHLQHGECVGRWLQIAVGGSNASVAHPLQPQHGQRGRHGHLCRGLWLIGERTINNSYSIGSVSGSSYVVVWSGITNH